MSGVSSQPSVNGDDATPNVDQGTKSADSSVPAAAVSTPTVVPPDAHKSAATPTAAAPPVAVQDDGHREDLLRIVGLLCPEATNSARTIPTANIRHYVRDLLTEIMDDTPEEVCEIMTRILRDELSKSTLMDCMSLPAVPNSDNKVVLWRGNAETSITINGIVYVVDPGFVKQKWYSAGSGMDILRVTLISKTAAQQRLGRAGRTKPGKCFRLYSKELFEDMQTDTPPEIQRVALQGTVLYLKVLGITDLGSFEFLDAPSDASLAEALEQLYYLGALDERGAVTGLGSQMAQFPLEPLLSRILIDSTERNCSSEMATVVAMLSVENLFYRGSRRSQEAANVALKKLFEEAEENYALGDHFLLLYVYEEWDRTRDKISWCRENFVNYTGMQTAKQIRKQLIDNIHMLHLPLRSLRDRHTDRHRENDDQEPRKVDWGVLVQCLCSGFFKQTARRQLGDTQFLLNNRGVQPPVVVHPTSMLCGREDEVAWVVFHNITWTSRGFMKNVFLLLLSFSHLPKTGYPYRMGMDSASLPESQAGRYPHATWRCPLHPRYAPTNTRINTGNIQQHRRNRSGGTSQGGRSQTPENAHGKHHRSGKAEVPIPQELHRFRSAQGHHTTPEITPIIIPTSKVHITHSQNHTTAF
ncbi:hypothetical protein Pelo_6325 [Pelomyxa schiedti]|nr:hypothetical protein Pelo_6325 [Pelomyxa schiedti]